MNTHLAALQESIIAETVVAYPDFRFHFATDTKGNLTADYRGAWTPERAPDPSDVPYLTIEHDGDRFLVSHYLWNERRKYKTLNGASKYVNGELKNSCDRQRKQKEKEDAEKEFSTKSVQLLRDFRDTLSRNNIAAKLCLIADRYNYNHLSIDAERVNTRIDITVSHDYRLEFAFSYPRFYTAPETALDILSVLSKEKTA